MGTEVLVTCAEQPKEVQLPLEVQLPIGEGGRKFRRRRWFDSWQFTT